MYIHLAIIIDLASQEINNCAVPVSLFVKIVCSTSFCLDSLVDVLNTGLLHFSTFEAFLEESKNKRDCFRLLGLSPKYRLLVPFLCFALL